MCECMYETLKYENKMNCYCIGPLAWLLPLNAVHESCHHSCFFELPRSLMVLVLGVYHYPTRAILQLGACDNTFNARYRHVT